MRLRHTTTAMALALMAMGSAPAWADIEAAKAFLDAAAGLLQDEQVLVYPPVPHAVARVADVERMQMLVEAGQRGRLQAFLRAWVPALIALKREHKAVLRWAVDVDPLAI